MRVSLIIPAAGKSLRMGGGIPKIYRPLKGVPVLLRSLAAFRGFPEIREIVLAVAPEEVVRLPRRWGSKLLRLGVTRIVPGGERRQDSVEAALSVTDPRSTHVLIHDAARPLVPHDVIRRVLAAGRRHDAVIPAVPVIDTIKRVDAAGSVLETLDRSRLRAVQTPQLFRRRLLLDVFAAAHRLRREGTDEARLVEAEGHAVRIVSGDLRNLKLTTPADFLVAAALLLRR